MSKIILINLNIDNDWDKEKVIEQIYSIKLESSQKILDSYRSWGIYEGESEDFAIVTNKIDLDFKKFINERIELAQEITESELGQLKQEKIKKFHFVGISSKESTIINEFAHVRNTYLSEESYISLNSKELLFKIAYDAGIKYPSSSLVQFKNFKILENEPLPYVLKYVSSAGGRGIFIITEDTKNLVSFINRQLEGFSDSLMFQKQEFVNVKSHFYTLAEVDFEIDQVTGFEIVYDKNRNSKQHVFTPNVSPERIHAAQEIASYLKKNGYRGGFGFDGFQSIDDEIFPAIDLNVRLDKSRMILNLARKYDIHKNYFEFRRERFYSLSYKNFNHFWNQRIPDLNSINKKYENRFFLIPVLFSNFFKNESIEEVVEVSFFIGHHSLEINGFNEWVKEIYLWLGIKENLT